MGSAYVQLPWLRVQGSPAHGNAVVYRLLIVCRLLFKTGVAVPICATILALAGFSYITVAVWVEGDERVPEDSRTLFWLAYWNVCYILFFAAAVGVSVSASAIAAKWLLDYLGIGRTLISEDAKKGLDRWSLLFNVMVVFFVLSGIWIFKEWSIHDTNGPSFCGDWHMYTSWNGTLSFHIIVRGLMIGIVCPSECAGLLPLYVAAVLSSGAIAERKNAIQSLNQDNAVTPWERVETGTLRLATDITCMPCLSDQGLSPLDLDSADLALY